MLAACNGDDIDVEKTDRLKAMGKTTPSTTTAVCTTAQLQKAQKLMDEKLVQTNCPQIVYINGDPDDTNTTYCSNALCVAALNSTNKELPPCVYKGTLLRQATDKLLNACKNLDADGNDDDASPIKAPNTTTPKSTPAQEGGGKAIVTGNGSYNIAATETMLTPAPTNTVSSATPLSSSP